MVLSPIYELLLLQLFAIIGAKFREPRRGENPTSYSIEHDSIQCRDLEAPVDYFQRMFDAEVILRRSLDESRRIIFLRIGESMLELMEVGPASDPVEPMKHYGVHHIGIKTDDLEFAHRDL